jgi:hypothetical protein
MGFYVRYCVGRTDFICGRAWLRCGKCVDLSRLLYDYRLWLRADSGLTQACDVVLLCLVLTQT